MSFACIIASVCLFSFTSASEVTPTAEYCLEQGCSQSATVLMQLKTQSSKGVAGKDSSEHHKTFEEACQTCQRFHPGGTCFAGQCSDGSGEFCWNDGTLADFKECPQDQQSLLSMDRGGSVSHKVHDSRDDEEKGASKHHDTFEEACSTCQQMPDATCFAGDCGDGSGKFCWSDGSLGDFKACAEKTKLLDISAPVIHKDTHEKQNVLGTALQSCSVKGTALTGFSRTGKCEDAGDDDGGSHHVCIQMKADFCTVTGQPNWCTEDADCMGQEGQCKIDHWCVCQWAFASYLQSAGGCEKSVDLVCEATNMAAFKAYEKSDDPSHKAALECIRSKCDIQ